MAGTIDNITKAAAQVADSVNGKGKPEIPLYSTTSRGSADITLYVDSGVLMLPDGGSRCSRGGQCTEQQPDLFLIGGGARFAYNFGGMLGVYGRFEVNSVDSTINEGRGALYSIGAGGQLKLLDDSLTMGAGLVISWSGDPLPVNEGPSEFGNVGFEARVGYTIVGGLGLFLQADLYPSVGYYNSSTNGDEDGVGWKLGGGLEYRFSIDGD